jgi:acyl-CoA synthetase (AMP-forming)/AMP-acid ligase II
VLVYDNANAGPRDTVPWTEGRDHWWQDTIPLFSTTAAVKWVDSEHPLFMLYTSGSTGKPKGVLHTTGRALELAGGSSHMYLFGRRGLQGCVKARCLQRVQDTRDVCLGKCQEALWGQDSLSLQAATWSWQRPPPSSSLT